MVGLVGHKDHQYIQVDIHMNMVLMLFRICNLVLLWVHHIVVLDNLDDIYIHLDCDNNRVHRSSLSHRQLK